MKILAARSSLLSYFLILLFSAHVNGQGKSFETRQQAWFGYIHQMRVSQRSGVWADFHFRMTDDFVKHKTMAIARIAYIYHVNDQVRLMAGHTFASRYNQSGVSRIPEHRPWQQIQWVENRKGFMLTQAFRLEQRFRKQVRDGSLDDDYNFNWRFRYNFTFTIPLRGTALLKHTPFVLLQNEILVNAGKSITYNYFDQYRSFTGLGYQFTRSTNAHLGYLFIFQQDGGAPRYLYIHAIRLFVTRSLDLREKRK